jgi:hypothetical protein
MLLAVDPGFCRSGAVANFEPKIVLIFSTARCRFSVEVAYEWSISGVPVRTCNRSRIPTRTHFSNIFVTIYESVAREGVVICPLRAAALEIPAYEHSGAV